MQARCNAVCKRLSMIQCRVLVHAHYICSFICPYEYWQSKLFGDTLWGFTTLGCTLLNHAPSLPSTAWWYPFSFVTHASISICKLKSLAGVHWNKGWLPCISKDILKDYKVFKSGASKKTPAKFHSRRGKVSSVSRNKIWILFSISGFFTQKRTVSRKSEDA